ncbi:MAG: hypothetical protein N3A66_05015, partial [Planctomycetota bacterium]|nr:hypothetical protein [Planctomycetota bacterium]
SWVWVPEGICKQQFQGEDQNKREEYFREVQKIDCNLFLDPDTGVAENANQNTHIAFAELRHIVCIRPRWLTLVYDQSYSRVSSTATSSHQQGGSSTAGANSDAIKGKIDRIKTLYFPLYPPIYAWGYAAHGNLAVLLLGCDRQKVDFAKEILIFRCGLPKERFTDTL